MNSAMNNEMALHYYCAIPAIRALVSIVSNIAKISWNKPGTGWPTSSVFADLTEMNRAEIRRPHFALLGFETAATPKLVQSVKAKEERIMDLLGGMEEILEK